MSVLEECRYIQTYNVRCCDLLDHICLVVLRIDGTIVRDGVDLLVIVANLSYSVRGVLLKLIDDGVHDLDTVSLGIPSENDAPYIHKDDFIST